MRFIINILTENKKKDIKNFLNKVICIPDIMEDYDYSSYCAQYRIYQYAILEFSNDLSNEEKKSFYKTLEILSKYNKNIEVNILTSNNFSENFQLKIIKNYSNLNIQFIDSLEVLKTNVLNKLGYYNNEGILEYKDLKYNQKNQEIFFKDELIKIQGKKSLYVLLFLLRNKKEIVNNETILNAVWEEPENVNLNNVELAILNIRKALKIDKDELIHTYHRHGYLLN